MRTKAFGTDPLGECDRCFWTYRRVDLKPQRIWQEDTIVDTGWLVCPTCMDESFPTGSTKRRYDDPPPIENPRLPREGYVTVPAWGEESS